MTAPPPALGVARAHLVAEHERRRSRSALVGRALGAPDVDADRRHPAAGVDRHRFAERYRDLDRLAGGVDDSARVVVGRGRRDGDGLDARRAGHFDGHGQHRARPVPVRRGDRHLVAVVAVGVDRCLVVERARADLELPARRDDGEVRGVRPAEGVAHGVAGVRIGRRDRGPDGGLGRGVLDHVSHARLGGRERGRVVHRRARGYGDPCRRGACADRVDRVKLERVRRPVGKPGAHGVAGRVCLSGRAIQDRGPVRIPCHCGVGTDAVLVPRDRLRAGVARRSPGERGLCVARCDCERRRSRRFVVVEDCDGRRGCGAQRVAGSGKQLDGDGAVGFVDVVVRR